MKTHELKLLPKYFEDVVEGNKTFEIRKDDRNYKIGDIVILNEYNPNMIWVNIKGENTHYSGRKVIKQIGYILKDIPNYGLKEGYVIIGIKNIHADIEE